MEHTPGPWHLEGVIIKNADGREIADILGLVSQRERKANATLITAAPDHALLLAALVSGKARWERLGNRGELCVSGLRHVLEIDDFGCPILTDAAREALI